MPNLDQTNQMPIIRIGIHHSSLGCIANRIAAATRPMRIHFGVLVKNDVRAGSASQRAPMTRPIRTNPPRMASFGLPVVA